MPKFKKTNVVSLIDCYNSNALSCLTEEQRVEMQAIIIKSYELGQEEAERKTAKLMSRIFSAFIGVDSGIDSNKGTESSRLAVLLKFFSRMKK
tara:strand:- start:50525 stop:50803 length:279 start_codon:yes stop_codon:yes gene_type:complete